MNRKVISIVLLLALTVGIMSPAGNAHSADSAQQLRQTGSPAPHRHTPAAEAAGNGFIENRGQVGNGEIRFYAASGGIAFGQGAVFLYCSEGPTAESRNGSDPGNPHLPRPGTGRVKTLRATFPGANPAVPEGTDPAPWGSNFLLGSDPDQWRTGVSSFQGVIYRNLWEGIDLAYTYRGGGLKYEFRLQPGADHVAGAAAPPEPETTIS